MENKLRARIGEESYQKLSKINNPALFDFIGKYIELCNPATVFVSNDSPEDVAYIRETTLKAGEEKALAISGHTAHFDAAGDQGRDKEHTNILVPKEVVLGEAISTRDRDHGLQEIHEILKDMMKGKELFISFFCLGPTNSEFSIPCVQLTDSSYVAHSERLLYRDGYEEFVRQGASAHFYKFVHSQGEVDARKVSKHLDKRRIYIDLDGEIVFSTNTQYGGNTIGLKKLAMRLAINQASKEGWLTEHMLVMGIHGPNRVTYFTGAFPSLCGKTSTAMLDGETIVGDDIAYLRNKNGVARAVNVEKGMFGIIQGINSKDDPLQWKALHNPGEIIFSNVLITPEKSAHWIGRDGNLPPKGENFSGEWTPDKKDAKGKAVPCSHPNARFTISLDLFDNLDPALHDPSGVEVGGIVYGGRDSDTCVPVEESFDWTHGIITKGAALESETTAATLGQEGVREFNPMSNLDFLSLPVGAYIQKNLDFGKGLKKAPKIFSVNYFLRDRETGKFLNEKNDKKVWYKWMELRAHHDVDAIKTPTGLIPKYEDLKPLFKQILNMDYTVAAYKKQFMTRVPENLAKIDRIKKIYETIVTDTPKILLEVLEEQRQRLLKAKETCGDYIDPEAYEQN
ncbi:MAG: phosphoenolpyruvate carboxykinase (GTP) [Thermodesulfobacteriota bacterium]|jgi:phosphoenolpyruvate carboxykinase (GTP)|nr:MAG: phosphoenolpyruvate carboxykinase (GTP) [Thermodesulfobacteriota bacterium]